MSRTIHGLSHKGLKAFRKKSAALPVYWIYVSRMNNEGVAWPSARGLAKDTGWNKATCLEARDYLIEIKALERVEDYTRPDWRDKTAQEKTRLLNFDRSEYYRPTGYIMVDNKKLLMLYNGADEVSSVDEKPSDVLQKRTSAHTGHPPTPDIQFGSTELNSPSYLGSSNSELGSSEEKSAPDGATPHEPPLEVVRSEKQTPSMKKPKWADEDCLIDVWAGVRKLDAIAMGADYHTKSDREKAHKMLAWVKPITPDEVREAMAASKYKGGYPFAFLEKDVLELRAKKAISAPPLVNVQEHDGSPMPTWAEIQANLSRPPQLSTAKGKAS